MCKSSFARTYDEAKHQNGSSDRGKKIFYCVKPWWQIFWVSQTRWYFFHPCKIDMIISFLWERKMKSDWPEALSHLLMIFFTFGKQVFDVKWIIDGKLQKTRDTQSINQDRNLSVKKTTLLLMCWNHFSYFEAGEDGFEVQSEPLLLTFNDKLKLRVCSSVNQKCTGNIGLVACSNLVSHDTKSKCLKKSHIKMKFSWRRSSRWKTMGPSLRPFNTITISWAV